MQVAPKISRANVRKHSGRWDLNEKTTSKQRFVMAIGEGKCSQDIGSKIAEYFHQYYQTIK